MSSTVSCPRCGGPCELEPVDEYLGYYNCTTPGCERPHPMCQDDHPAVFWAHVLWELVVATARGVLWLAVGVFALVAFVLSVPSLTLHELAHYVACLPWGGPDGVYLIYDRSKPGLASRIPVGAAVYHTGINERNRLLITFAPLAYLVLPVFVHPVSKLADFATIIVFLAGFATVGDGLKFVSPGLYERLLDSNGEHEFRLFMDLTVWREGRDPPPTMHRE